MKNKNKDGLTFGGSGNLSPASLPHPILSNLERGGSRGETAFRMKEDEEEKKKVLVGLSGGVDSAVAAYLLKKAGYDVTAGFMINYLAPEGEYCPTREDLKVAKEVAAFLEIPFFTFDYRDTYAEKVLKYMYEGYKKGITPNPDIMCNSEVKFKVFLEEALELGFDFVATGHYARIKTPSPLNSLCPHPGIPSPIGRGRLQGIVSSDEELKSKKVSPLLPFSLWEKGLGDEGGRFFHLLKGIDKNKDQSYFLAGLNQFQLSKSIFPIGDMKKEEVRKLALEIGLPNAERKDSQGICFVGKVDMVKFLEKKINPVPGIVKDTAGNILGEHKGVFYYTIGQRKGLDIGGQKEPIFVVKKDIEKNEIIVGTKDDLQLYDDKLFIKEMHFLTPHPNSLKTSPPTPLQFGEGGNGKINFTFPMKAKAKIRYRQEDQNCLVDFDGERYLVEFEKKQRAIASGQICAIYLGDELVMSGVIE